MNLFKRIMRLPFVTRANPVLSISVWAVVTLVSFRNNIANTPGRLLPTSGVRGLTPFTLVSSIISRFSSNRLNSGSLDRVSWVFDTGISLIRFLIENFNRTIPTEITTNEMPSIVGGYIQSSHLVNNMQGNTFVIGISEQVINYLGFTFVIFKGVLFFIGLIVFFKFLFNRFINPSITRFLDPTIDITAKSVNESVFHSTTPAFIEKYITKQ